MDKVNALFRSSREASSATFTMRSMVMLISISHGCLGHDYLSLRLVLQDRLGLILTLVLNLPLISLLINVHSMSVGARVNYSLISRGVGSLAA